MSPASRTAPPGDGKSALILGVTGQDGAYLAAWLLGLGYRVCGVTRRVSGTAPWRLERLGIAGEVALAALPAPDPQALLALIREHGCAEVYALSAQSSVGASFARPHETIGSIVDTATAALEAVRLAPWEARLFLAGSIEMFGGAGGEPVREDSPLAPCSPYGAARAAARIIAREYAARYGLFVALGLLCNHESPLRGDQFVTLKIVRAAQEIARGRAKPLELGNIEVVRDFGWAPEYVQAMWRMLQAERPAEYVIATGVPYSLKNFLADCFALHGLDWSRHVRINPAFIRPDEPPVIRADPSAIRRELGWSATVSGAGLVRRLARAVAAQRPDPMRRNP